LLERDCPPTPLLPNRLPHVTMSRLRRTLGSYSTTAIPQGTTRVRIEVSVPRRSGVPVGETPAEERDYAPRMTYQLRRARADAMISPPNSLSGSWVLACGPCGPVRIWVQPTEPCEPCDPCDRITRLEPSRPKDTVQWIGARIGELSPGVTTPKRLQPGIDFPIPEWKPKHSLDEIAFFAFRYGSSPPSGRTDSAIIAAEAQQSSLQKPFRSAPGR
jgi:hypothetical protein